MAALYRFGLIVWFVYSMVMKQELFQKEQFDDFGRETILLGVKETLLN